MGEGDPELRGAGSALPQGRDAEEDLSPSDAHGVGVCPQPGLPTQGLPVCTIAPLPGTARGQPPSTACGNPQ